MWWKFDPLQREICANPKLRARGAGGFGALRERPWALIEYALLRPPMASSAATDGQTELLEALVADEDLVSMLEGLLIDW